MSTSEPVPLKLPPQRVRVRTFARMVQTEKELTRLFMVVALFLVFGGTVLGAFHGAGTDHWANVKALLDVLLPAETALLGTAVAFYMTK
jgi:hypothetical protein